MAASLAFDSNVFIYVLGKHPEFWTPSLALLKAVEAGAIDGWASELAYLELLSDKTLQTEDLTVIEKFLGCTTVSFQVINRDILIEAARLRRQQPSLKTPDAIHLATALRHGAKYFVTNDHKLIKMKFSAIQAINLADAQSYL